MKKIISNYIIEEDNKKGSTSVSKAPPIIKIPIVDEKNISIRTESNTANKITEPVLQLNRNHEGIVLSIEVQCTCGERIIIKLDY
ncbi:MAG TPA: hypothetical protein PKJ08_06985 [Candidatus Cloacimonadota bacterium]|jgi:hypothetical protein|nr:hypothetical protein [Candidatus Cloacimonadota bacterium]HOD54252.1 hypothetical protein [Candidatus Cloacimonadota bacterium]